MGYVNMHYEVLHRGKCHPTLWTPLNLRNILESRSGAFVNMLAWYVWPDVAAMRIVNTGH